jgi:hypothetical protein
MDDELTVAEIRESDPLFAAYKQFLIDRSVLILFCTSYQPKDPN